MASYSPVTPWTLTIPQAMMQLLHDHLFPAHGGEHGAVIAAGIVQSTRGTRLLARNLFLARDGTDYVPGSYGHRKLTASFVRDQALYCRDEQLVYLAVHGHGGTDSVAFSTTDLESHERGYPALLDITRGLPVGALVFARNAVAGDIWLPDRQRVPIQSARVIGALARVLRPQLPPRPHVDVTYDRQARLLSDRGQAILAELKVGIIGAGGAGSLLVQYIAHLGVGHLVIIDPERIEITNLPRVVGSTRWDARTSLTDPRRPAWLRNLGQRHAAHKVRIARRIARAANPTATIETIAGSIVEDKAARRLVDCDYLFLAADTMQARLVFNALIHQYLIPGAQVGAKVLTDGATGDLIDVFSVYRPVTPDQGCLWCNGLIDTARLQTEALNEQERRAQQYVDDPTVVAPSVITLNGIGTALAANDFLFTMTGLLAPDAPGDYLRLLPRSRDIRFDNPRRDSHCTECGTTDHSRLGRGDSRSLPTRK